MHGPNVHKREALPAQLSRDHGNRLLGRIHPRVEWLVSGTSQSGSSSCRYGADSVNGRPSNSSIAQSMSETR